MIEIRVEGPLFYSLTDEDYFVDWFEKIDALVSTAAELRDIMLYFHSAVIPDTDLRELIALFTRYRLDMRGLSVFLNDSNRSWLANPEKFWFAGIFGASGDK